MQLGESFDICTLLLSAIVSLKFTFFSTAGVCQKKLSNCFVRFRICPSCYNPGYNYRINSISSSWQPTTRSNVLMQGLVHHLGNQQLALFSRQRQLWCFQNSVQSGYVAPCLAGLRAPPLGTSMACVYIRGTHLDVCTGSEQPCPTMRC